MLIIHSRAVYKPTNQWSFGAAMTYSAQRPQNPFTEPRPATQELRPWQEVAYNQVLSKQFSLNFRIRTEERFISKHSGELDGTYTFIFRHRYRAQLTYLLPKKNLTFRASEEVFANAFNGNRFDQNRLYVSAEKRFNPALSFEIGYMKIYQPGRIVNQIFKRDNLRLTLYHTIRPL